MSVLLALLLAADPAANQVAEKKPKLRCEWIHEVGTSRPRRVCEQRQPKADKPAATAAPQQSPEASAHQHHTPGH